MFGGTETYLLTVANELQRLGHEVGIYAGAGGEQVEVARRRGFSTVVEERRLPARPQVVISQHAESAYAMALRYPESVRVYVAHSPIFQPQRPPLLSGTCHAIVALNERVKLQCESLAVDTEVARLRQPVDTARFTDRGARGRLRRVLMLGNHFGDRLYRNHRIVAEACEDLGLELDHIGTGGRASTSPEIEIPAADVVVGIGRCVLETMACGRAAYVFGNRGGDGWVTGETYPVLEARGFAGTATDTVVDAERLRADLEHFEEDMGQINRHLALTHHDAVRHAAELVALFERLEPGPPANRSLLEPLAGMVRVQWETDERVALAETDSRNLRLEAGRLREQRDALQAHLDAVLGGRRYRLGRLLSSPLELLRRARGRRER